MTRGKISLPPARALHLLMERLTYLINARHPLTDSPLNFQLGIAVGFILPPKLVRNHDSLDMIGDDLKLMFYMIAGLTTVLVVLVIVCE